MGRIARVGWITAMLGAPGACAKHEAGPPSPLQDGAPVAVAIDARPVAIDAPPPRAPPTATKLVVGARAACAILSDATVRCWGDNGEGQLGDGSTRGSPTAVTPNVRGVKDLVMGDDFTCALIDDSSVVCWGKLGYGKDRRLLVPTAAPGVRDMVRIFAVGGAACATARSGALVCWGSVDPRGHITTAGASHAPTPVPGIDHVLLLSAHAAVSEAHVLSTWTDGGAPVPTAFDDVRELAERDEPCALREGGQVVCIGDHPRCGAPIAVAASVPSAPAPAPPAPTPARTPRKPRTPGTPGRRGGKPAKPASSAEKLVAYALPERATHLAFDTGVCVVAQKRLDCFDLDHACKATRPWPAFVTIEDRAGGCARLANGTVRCGAPGGSAAPVIAGVTEATAISATATRGCALGKDHRVRCWEGTSPATAVELNP